MRNLQPKTPGIDAILLGALSCKLPTSLSLARAAVARQGQFYIAVHLDKITAIPSHKPYAPKVCLRVDKLTFINESLAPGSGLEMSLTSPLAARSGHRISLPRLIDLKHRSVEPELSVSEARVTLGTSRVAPRALHPAACVMHGTLRTAFHWKSRALSLKASKLR